jgi:DNA-binding CsgD family transcriptional regulator
MAETGVAEPHLADVVASAYEAATGGSTWFGFGALLCDLVGAQRATLRMTDGTLANLLRASDQADADYLSHYHLVDPYRARFAGNFASGGSPPNTVSLGQDIVPRSQLLLGEYFTDYAARHGQQHMMGGTIGLAQPLPIGLHRDATAGAFTENESRKLEFVLPHLTRALQLRSRMVQDMKTRAVETTALDALSLCVIVVDAGMRVLHANSAAVALTAGSRAGLRIFAPARDGLRLAARHRDDSRHLEHLVAAAAAGGSGGSLRVRAQPDDVPETASLAVLVSPAPNRFATRQSGQLPPGLASGTALVVARELAQPLAVAPARLSDLYGLTHAEAAIAVSLAGGVTAEDVARGRQVSLDTVRSQVRTVLRKTNAANLRDFERILALVSAS